MTSHSETAWAAEAFLVYLQLPNPRNLESMVGLKITAVGKTNPKPLSLNTLRRWMTRNHWLARAAEFDERMAKEEIEAIRRARIADRERREKERLAIADDMRQMARDYLRYPEDWPDEQLRGTLKPLALCDPHHLRLAADFAKQAGDSERLDLGTSILREEQQAPPQPVIVVSPDAMPEIREAIRRVSELADDQRRKALSQGDIIDAEVVTHGQEGA